MRQITEKMKQSLVKLHGEIPKAAEHEARIMMLNTLLGDGFIGEFNFNYDTREEARIASLNFSELYDVDVIENTEERYFHFDTSFKNSLYHGISAKLNY